MGRGLNADYYRLAAERILAGNNEFSCLAIEEAILKSRKQANYNLYPTIDAHLDAYLVMFGPVGVDGSIIDNSRHPFWNKNVTPERQQLRVQALLMMAELVESGKENYYRSRWAMRFSQR